MRNGRLRLMSVHDNGDESKDPKGKEPRGERGEQEQSSENEIGEKAKVEKVEQLKSNENSSFKDIDLTTYFQKIDKWFEDLMLRIKKGDGPSSATRHNLQLGRRFFHFMNGAILATLYNLFLEHRQIVYVIGLLASLLYLLEQIRLAYPEFASKFRWFSNFLLRAEEQLKESAAIPYMMALLLTIISFPKVIAVIAIYTLSLADPLSAIVGILYGKKKIGKRKTLEGSTAFFITTFIVCMVVLLTTFSDHTWAIVKVSLLVAFFASLFEVLPIKIDDNLTIPLSTALICWIFCLMMGLPIY